MTVTVAVVVPFALIELGLELNIEMVGLTAPDPKVTVGVVAKVSESVVSVAV